MKKTLLVKRISCLYFFEDQEDWKLIENYTGLEKAAIIDRLIRTKFTLAMLGFLPGFLYLRGLDKTLQIPRKTKPSKYVKANSIAIGGPYLGVYAIDSPGGWHVIAKTPIPILDIFNLSKPILNLGDQIVLKAINLSEYQSILAQQLTLSSYNAKN